MREQPKVLTTVLINNQGNDLDHGKNVKNATMVNPQLSIKYNVFN